VLGPVLGPLVGGFAAQAEGWRWTIWELMWLSGFCLVFVFFFPETSSGNICTGDDKLKCKSEIMAEHMTGKVVPLMVLVHPFMLNLTEPMIFMLCLYIALIYGLLYIWVTLSPTPSIKIIPNPF
jgi:DHA1 family multidrug resistance protein-like MFS transporter